MTELDIATHIADHRKALGLTQTDLANRLGVTLRTVQRWERPGSTAALPHLEEVAGALNSTPAGLLGFEEAPRPVEERLAAIEQQIAAVLAVLRTLARSLAPEQVLREADELLARELGVPVSPAEADSPA